MLFARITQEVEAVGGSWLAHWFRYVKTSFLLSRTHWAGTGGALPTGKVLNAIAFVLRTGCQTGYPVAQRFFLAYPIPEQRVSFVEAAREQISGGLLSLG